MISYKKLIISAVQIVLNHKYLWFFGLFAAFLSSGGAYRRVYGGDRGASLVDDWEKLKNTGVFDFSIFNKIIELAQQDPAGLTWRIIVLLIVLVLGVFLLWLAVVSQGALINSVAKIYIKKSTDFKEGLKSGRTHFWPVFFFRMLEKLIIFGLFSLSSLSIILTLNYSDKALIRFVYFIVIALILFLIVLVVLIVRYSISYGIIKGLRFIEALQAGFNLLKNKLWLSIEAGVVIFVINFLLGFLVLMLIAAAAIPFVFLMFLFYKLAFAAGLTFVLVAGVIALFVVVAITGGILSSFSDAFWTILFITLLRENPRSFLRSLFNKKI